MLGMPRWLKIDHASAKAGKVLVIVDTRKEKVLTTFSYVLKTACAKFDFLIASTAIHGFQVYVDGN